jgi:cell division protein ZapB
MGNQTENPTHLDRLGAKVGQMLQEVQTLRSANEVMRNELVQLKAEKELKDQEIQKLEDENAMKDLEIEEVVSKIEAMLG